MCYNIRYNCAWLESEVGGVCRKADRESNVLLVERGTARRQRDRTATSRVSDANDTDV